MYQFTDNLLIGEAVIDQEHRYLFQILNEAQKKAHHAFIEKIDDINPNGADVTIDEYLEDVIDYLLYWLSNHIFKMDTLIPVVE